jgi:hypothetical protein
MKIPKIEYEVYYPIYSMKNLTKLDLSVCQGSKVDFSIAVKIEDDLDKYNTSSGYYNDICSKTTSESGTDIPLKDRKNEFVDNNMTLCEENCEYIGYDKINKLVHCNCDVKDSSTMISDIKVDKSKLYDFMSIDKLANFDVLKCVNLVTKIENLIINIGFYCSTIYC